MKKDLIRTAADKKRDQKTDKPEGHLEDETYDIKHTIKHSSHIFHTFITLRLNQATQIYQFTVYQPKIKYRTSSISKLTEISVVRCYLFSAA